MKPIQFRHGWVISEGLGGKIASFQLVSTLPVPFSSDFDTIVMLSIWKPLEIASYPSNVVIFI